MRRFSWMLLTGLLIGCAPDRVTPTPTPPAPTATTTITVDASHPSEPQIEPTIAPSPTLGGPLANSGIQSNPRVLFLTGYYNTVGNLWSVAPDGSNLRQLTTAPTLSFAVRKSSGADNQVLVAFLSVANDARENPSLNLLSLPDEKIELITPLILPHPDRDEFEAYTLRTAVTGVGDFQWSPDGQWLAFIGGLYGATADIYSYELATKQVRWLTSGDDYILQLVWSPDSQWIVHTAVSDFESSGSAAMRTTGTWAASPDGGSLHRLEDDRPTYLSEWLTDEIVVAYGYSGFRFNEELRTINIRIGETNELEPSCFSSVSFAPEYEVYLVGVIVAADACSEEDWDQGLYLVSKTDVFKLSDEYWLAEGYWSSEQQMFLSYDVDNTLTAILPNGLIVKNLAVPTPPRDARVFDGGNLWVWVEAGHLYAAIAPNYEPVMISGDLQLHDWAVVDYIP